MQQAVDVVEDVLLGDVLPIESLALAMDEVSDGVLALVGCLAGKVGPEPDVFEETDI